MIVQVMRARGRKRDRKRRLERIRNHLCIDCGDRKPEEGILRCGVCAEAQNAYIAELQQERKRLGFCIQCGEIPDLNKHGKRFARCRVCRNADARRLREKRALKKAGLDTGLGILKTG